MTCSKNTNNIRCYSTAWNQASIMSTIDRVDLTNYNYLKAYVATGGSAGGGYWNADLSINSSCNQWGGCSSPSVSASVVIGQNQTTTYTLDISEYSGLYYTRIVAYYVANIYLYQMWLEK